MPSSVSICHSETLLRGLARGSATDHEADDLRQTVIPSAKLDTALSDRTEVRNFAASGCLYGVGRSQAPRRKLMSIWDALADDAAAEFC